MLPPTYLTCLEVGRTPLRREVLGPPRERDPVEMFMPGVERSATTASLSIPERCGCS